MTNSSYCQKNYLTDIELDSVFAKIERGKINAKRVTILNNALNTCDSVKILKTEIIQYNKEQIDNLYKVIDKDKLIIDNLNETIKLEVKRGRRRGFWNFLKGTTAGVLVILILQAVT